jgi:hypothetical protein
VAAQPHRERSSLLRRFLVNSKQQGQTSRRRVSHHANPLAVGTDPRRSVTDTPFIFLETLFADHKTAGATPAKFLLLFATVANVFALSTLAIALLLRILFIHFVSSVIQLL